MKIQLDPGAYMPTRAHKDDAGLDLYVPEGSNFIVPAHGFHSIDTGVHIEIPAGYAGFIKSRSGLNRSFGIVCDGTIDAGYTGSIGVTLHNRGEDYYHFRAGDKIAQLVIIPVLRPVLEPVDELDETERGANGFGSTGR